jgi:hypothetical protein
MYFTPIIGQARNDPIFRLLFWRLQQLGRRLRIIFVGSEFTYDIFSLQIGCFFTSVTNKTQYSRVISSQREFIRMFDFNILTLFFRMSPRSSSSSWVQNPPFYRLVKNAQLQGIAKNESRSVYRNTGSVRFAA